MALTRTAGLFVSMISALGISAGGDPVSAAPSGTPLQLTGISPTAGPLGGGNQVTIRTNDAAAVTSVGFGAASGGAITHISPHLLRVVAPAHDAGPVGVVLHTASATSPAGRYQFVPTPDPLHLQWSRRLGTDAVIGDLQAIGCTVHRFCAIQLGRGRLDSDTTALITLGLGRPRRIQRLPSDTFVQFLVACGTPRFCVAGGRSGLWTWNGSKWHGPTRLAAGGDWALGCAPGTTRCVLGGEHSSFVHGRHGWRKVGFPHGFGRPTSLACATPSFCLAVRKGRTVRFNGTSWRVDTLRHVPRYIGCASAHYCLGAGMNHAAVFDGTRWHTATAPPGHGNVRSVSCIAVGRCVAATHRYAETFTHGRWTKSQVVSPPRELAPAPLGLNGLACVPHEICRATTSRGQILRLVHGHWAGAKNITAYHGRLSDISCASPTWCMAVGLSGEAFRYAGGKWSREGDVDGRHPLVSISCTEDKVCVAVDAATGTKSSGPLSGGRAVRYAHGSWQRPVVIETGHQLTDISCASDRHCVAVEYEGRAITYRHRKWSKPTSLKQRPKGGLRFIAAVDCPTVRYCAAAGYPNSHELIDGTWRKIDSGQPAPDPQDTPPLGTARGVDCVAADYCVFTDLFGVVIRNDGVVGWGYPGCCDGGRAVSCASRTYCVAVYKDETHEDFATRTYLLAGAAVRRERKFSLVEGHIPRGVACFSGPVCVGVGDTRAFVGS